jgi:polyisoprenoid-binding protein YceI
MLRMNTVLFALALAAIGCGSNDSKDAGTSTGDAASYANGCIDLAGTWTIANHCNSSLVGTQVGVTQSTCTVTTSGAFPGLTGEVESDGSFDISGTISGVNIACTGNATAQKITESCTGGCAVVLTR